MKRADDTKMRPADDDGKFKYIIAERTNYLVRNDHGNATSDQQWYFRKDF